MNTISDADLIKIIGDSPAGYRQRIGRHFCPVMRTMGLCKFPSCQGGLCRKQIAEIASGIHQGARDPNAVLVWRIRNQIAKIREQQAKEYKGIEKDRLGRPKSVDYRAILG